MLAEISSIEGIVTAVVTIVLFFAGLHWQLRRLAQSVEQSSQCIVDAVSALRHTLDEHRNHDRLEHRDILRAISETATLLARIDERSNRR